MLVVAQRALSMTDCIQSLQLHLHNRSRSILSSQKYDTLKYVYISSKIKYFSYIRNNYVIHGKYVKYVKWVFTCHIAAGKSKEVAAAAATTTTVAEAETATPPEPVAVPSETIYLRTVEFLLDAKATPVEQPVFSQLLQCKVVKSSLKDSTSAPRPSQLSLEMKIQNAVSGLEIKTRFQDQEQDCVPRPTGHSDYKRHEHF